MEQVACLASGPWCVLPHVTASGCTKLHSGVLMHMYTFTNTNVWAHTYMCTWVGHACKVRHQEGGSPRKQAAARGPAGAQRGPLSRSPRARLKTRCARPPAAAHAQGQRTGKRQCARGSASTATSTAWVGRMAHKEGDHLESLGIVDPRRHAAGRERRVDERQIPVCVKHPPRVPAPFPVL